MVSDLEVDSKLLTFVLKLHEMKISIVLGTQFGDEGKGSTVNFLTRDSKLPLVVRFNGGHQAGHNVVHDGIQHIFSSFGAGTLNGTPTFWSKYCTIFPSGFNVEYDSLIAKGIRPQIFIDPSCPITTPFDVDWNRFENQSSGHGSCGVGFGKTIWRHETLDHSYRIFAKDLKYEWILREKLNAMKTLIPKSGSFNININSFLKSVKTFLERVEIQTEAEVFGRFAWEDIVFEGAQGIMLDREHGIFPHVTRSHCTSKNAIEIIERNKLFKWLVNYNKESFSIYYISRCYQTRHGNGPLNGESKLKMEHLQGLESETNVTNDWQGQFRYAPFYFPNLDYAIETDSTYNEYLKPHRVKVITCMDQIKNKFPVLEDNGNVKYLSQRQFIHEMGSNSIFTFDSSFKDYIKI